MMVKSVFFEKNTFKHIPRWEVGVNLNNLGVKGGSRWVIRWWNPIGSLFWRKNLKISNWTVFQWLLGQTEIYAPATWKCLIFLCESAKGSQWISLRAILRWDIPVFETIFVNSAEVIPLKTSETLWKCPYYAYTVNAPSQGWGWRLDVLFLCWKWTASSLCHEEKLQHLFLQFINLIWKSNQWHHRHQILHLKHFLGSIQKALKI